MPTTITDGKRIAEIELLEIFKPYDGMITQYYGRIGSGKTYAATADILDLLRKGQVVYANWKINYHGYDERKSVFRVFVTLLFPWIRTFYFFPKENLKFISVDEKFHDNFGKLTDCHVFLDEGHVVFDSYEMARLSIEKRKSILHTRHYNRSIHIVSQRPTAIHVAMRANVNVFYKCEKTLSWPFIRFRRTEYQDMLNENVDEGEEKIIDIKGYWGKQRIFNAYDTKYLRGETPPSQKINFEAWRVSYIGRLILFFKNLFSSKKRGTMWDNVGENGSVEPDNKEKLSPLLSKRLPVSREKVV